MQTAKESTPTDAEHSQSAESVVASAAAPSSGLSFMTLFAIGLSSWLLL
jgi:hypothetical protein